MTEPLGLVTKAQDGLREAVLFNRSRGMSEAALERLSGGSAARLRILQTQVAGLLLERDALRTELRFCRALLQRSEAAAIPDPAALVAAVASAFGCRAEDITGRNRKRPFAWARHCAMALLSELPGQTQSGVGGMIGGFHHTTVLHAKRRHRQRLAAAIGLPVKSGGSQGRPPEQVLRSECRAYAAKVADVRAALGWSA